jgi:hypothetical protein
MGDAVTARRLAALTVAGLVVGMLSMTAGVTVPAVAGMASRAASAQNAFNAEAVQNAQGARASQDVQVVTLITGDRVAISTTPDRKPQVNVMPAVKGTSFQVMTLGTQVYVIPQTAAGYLGTPLDPSLFDVTSGTNGDNCSGTYLCAAVPGYDGPTGLGTPDGTGSF